MLIPTPANTKTITDMREDALGLLNNIDKQGVTYIFHRSKPKAVLLSIDDFIRLSELLEDYFDEEEAKRLAKEPRGKGFSLEETAKKYV